MKFFHYNKSLWIADLIGKLSILNLWKLLLIKSKVLTSSLNNTVLIHTRMFYKSQSACILFGQLSPLFYFIFCTKNLKWQKKVRKQTILINKLSKHWISVSHLDIFEVKKIVILWFHEIKIMLNFCIYYNFFTHFTHVINTLIYCDCFFSLVKSQMVWPNTKLH